MRKFLFSCTMLAALGANAVADEPDCPFASRSEPGVCPFVSGGEPRWGNKMSPTQRRYDHKPNTPVSGVPGYAFKLLTMRKRGRFATVKSEPFGVFGSMQECDIARAAKIAELDASNLRQGDYIGPTVSTTRIHSNWHGVGPVLNGTSSSVTADEPTGPFEKMDVTFCEPGVFSPAPTPSPNIARPPRPQQPSPAPVPTP